MRIIADIYKASGGIAMNNGGMYSDEYKKQCKKDLAKLRKMLPNATFASPLDDTLCTTVTLRMQIGRQSYESAATLTHEQYSDADVSKAQISILFHDVMGQHIERLLGQ